MKIYLIRHGQTTGDIEDRYGGTYDDHLTIEGELQAKKVAAELILHYIRQHRALPGYNSIPGRI